MFQMTWDKSVEWPINYIERHKSQFIMGTLHIRVISS